MFVHETVPMSNIKPYEKNPRVISKESVEYVAKSIEEFGYKNPILVDESYTIINGHTRYAALTKLGYQEISIIVASGLSSDQVKALRIADNRSSDFGNWDTDLLFSEVNEIAFNSDFLELNDLYPADESHHEEEEIAVNDLFEIKVAGPLALQGKVVSILEEVGDECVIKVIKKRKKKNTN